MQVSIQILFWTITIGYTPKIVVGDGLFSIDETMVELFSGAYHTVTKYVQELTRKLIEEPTTSTKERLARVILYQVMGYEDYIRSIEDLRQAGIIELAGEMLYVFFNKWIDYLNYLYDNYYENYENTGLEYYISIYLLAHGVNTIAYRVAYHAIKDVFLKYRDRIYSLLSNIWWPAVISAISRGYVLNAWAIDTVMFIKLPLKSSGIETANVGVGYQFSWPYVYWYW